MTKTNKPTPRPVRAFEENPRKEDNNVTFSEHTIHENQQLNEHLVLRDFNRTIQCLMLCLATLILLSILELKLVDL